ncbi:hypothetical protein [Streptomyces torulosus]|nr:hypothetical protein [Streptomyces torulosus]
MPGTTTFFRENSQMLFGDAQKRVEDILCSLDTDAPVPAMVGSR